MLCYAVYLSVKSFGLINIYIRWNKTLELDRACAELRNWRINLHPVDSLASPWGASPRLLSTCSCSRWLGAGWCRWPAGKSPRTGQLHGWVNSSPQTCTSLVVKAVVFPPEALNNTNGQEEKAVTHAPVSHLRQSVHSFTCEQRQFFSRLVSLHLFIYQARESSLVPAEFLTAQFFCRNCRFIKPFLWKGN